MFSENKKGSTKSKKPKDFSKEQNKIAKGTTFVGDIESQGSFRIEGTLKGSLKTPGKIVVGETGVIEGDVDCSDADFEGKFKGKLNVKNRLILKSASSVDGDIITGRLSVEPGADLNGTCKMKSSLNNKKSQNEPRQEQQKQDAQKNA